MRAIRVKGAKVHEEVMRAYARAAVEAAERARKEDFQRRAQLNNKPTAPTAEGAPSEDAPDRAWPRRLQGQHRPREVERGSREDPKLSPAAQGLVAEAPEGQGSGAQRRGVALDSPISLTCRGRDMGEAA